MLVKALAELSRGATDDFSAETMLTRLCEVAGTAIGLDGAGVMLTEKRHNRFVHATTTTVAPAERLQELLRTGPCHEALLRREPVVIDDLAEAAANSGWLVYAATATQLGLRSVVAVPLVARGQTWGVLDLYRSTPQPWTEEERDAAAVLADSAVSYLVMAHDRDTARTAQLALAHQAMHDELTGLPNRALVYDRLEHALRAARRRPAAVAALFIDLDRFKQINDTFGHAGGDTVLTEVARRMSATLRAGDTLGRLAGDEFVLICEDVPTDTTQIHGHIAAVTARLRAAFDAPIRLAGVDVSVSASIGVAVTTDGPTAQDLLGEAVSAMYGAKQRGRGMVVVRDHPATWATPASSSATSPWRWNGTSSPSTTSPSCPAQLPSEWPRWRRCCAGATPTGLSCQQRPSSTWPSAAGSSPPSAAGSSPRPAPRCGRGPTSSATPRRTRPTSTSPPASSPT